MGKVVIQGVQDAAIGHFPVAAGLSSTGAVKVLDLVTAADQSIHLRVYEMAPGARIDIQHAATGHALYVWDGSASAEGTHLASGGALIVEHGGSASLEAGPSGTKVAHFQRNPAFAPVDTKAGGHVHVVPPEGIFNCPVSASDAAYVIWADSSCPTCDLWLHQTHMPRPTNQGGHHFHSEDEMVFLVGGSMKLGNRTLQPGTALAISANTIYGFGVPQGGTRFINFRCRESFVVRTKNAKPIHAPINEREVLRTGAGNMKGLEVEVAGGH